METGIFFANKTEKRYNEKVILLAEEVEKSWIKKGIIVEWSVRFAKGISLKNEMNILRGVL